MKNSKILSNLTHQRELCHICHRPIIYYSERENEEHICADCSRLFHLCSRLANILANLKSHSSPDMNITLKQLLRIRYNDGNRVGTCLICGGTSYVTGYLHPHMSCKCCHLEYEQFNNRVNVYDTLLETDLPYDTEEWLPFDSRSGSDEVQKIAKILSIFKELKL